ncbi:transposase [Methylorubrum rhodesianum]|uniref:transposase n=1 Tax=Methylorubrum rhodesianum TaxID=29427 RepID=UPI003D15E944
MPVSGDTVLRLSRRGIAPAPPPRVVGIDDWAWRRGRSYGTIVCDLERHRVFDLLPGRSAAPVRDWLAAHPSVSVVRRLGQTGACSLIAPAPFSHRSTMNRPSRFSGR